jgi:hypothetical protein
MPVLTLEGADGAEHKVLRYGRQKYCRNQLECILDENQETVRRDSQSELHGGLGMDPNQPMVVPDIFLGNERDLQSFRRPGPGFQGTSPAQ